MTAWCGKKYPCKDYGCVHPATDTKIYRKLSEHKGKRDLEDGVTRLQEKLKIKRSGCQWGVMIPYKCLTRGGSNMTRILGTGRQEHTREVALSPMDQCQEYVLHY